MCFAYGAPLFFVVICLLFPYLSKSWVTEFFERYWLVVHNVQNVYNVYNEVQCVQCVICVKCAQCVQCVTLHKAALFPLFSGCVRLQEVHFLHLISNNKCQNSGNKARIGIYIGSASFG